MKKTNETTGMIHLNGNMLAVVDTETTNADPRKAEIIEIAVVPVDSRLQVHELVLPFHIKMKPENIENIDERSMSVNKQKLHDLMRHGVSQDEGMDLFIKWFEGLKLPFLKRIMPLGHNYLGYDKLVISNWLGQELYEQMFHFHVRDSMVCALYMNDRAYYQGIPFPFQKVGLTPMCRQLGVTRGDAHTAIDDCLATLEVYRRMLGTVGGLLPDFDTEGEKVAELKQ